MPLKQFYYKVKKSSRKDFKVFTNVMLVVKLKQKNYEKILLIYRYIKPKKLAQAYKKMTVKERALFFHLKQRWGVSYLLMNKIDNKV